MYGSLDSVSILTLAPELLNARHIIKALVSKDITVALGKTMSMHSVRSNWAIGVMVEAYDSVLHQFHALKYFYFLLYFFKNFY